MGRKTGVTIRSVEPNLSHFASPASLGSHPRSLDLLGGLVYLLKLY